MDETPFLTSQYPIDRLTAVLDNSQVASVPVAGGYWGVILIDDAILSDQDRDILRSFMRASEFPASTGLAITMRGSDRAPIVFEYEKDAKLTAQSQIPNLGKQLLFSIYRKTGVKFSLGPQTFNP